MLEKLRKLKRGDVSRICIKLLGEEGRTGESGGVREANHQSYFAANVASYQ
jgi:hypothetical protein